MTRLAPGQHAEHELLGLDAPIAVGPLEPLQTGPSRPLQTLHLGSSQPLIFVEGLVRGRCRRAGARERAIASSMASLVPDPTEKWAVCMASPMSTTFSWCHRAHVTVGNCSHLELFPIRP